MVNDIPITRRDTEVITVNVTDSAGSAIDITGYSFFFTVKTNKTDLDADALISKDVTSHNDPTNGQTQISLSVSDTDLAENIYHYDIQMKDTSNNITTLLVGHFIINQDVSVRTS